MCENNINKVTAFQLIDAMFEEQMMYTLFQVCHKILMLPNYMYVPV